MEKGWDAFMNRNEFARTFEALQSKAFANWCHTRAQKSTPDMTHSLFNACRLKAAEDVFEFRGVILSNFALENHGKSCFSVNGERYTIREEGDMKVLTPVTSVKSFQINFVPQAPNRGLTAEVTECFKEALKLVKVKNVELAFHKILQEEDYVLMKKLHRTDFSLLRYERSATFSRLIVEHKSLGIWKISQNNIEPLRFTQMKCCLEYDYAKIDGSIVFSIDNFAVRANVGEEGSRKIRESEWRKKQLLSSMTRTEKIRKVLFSGV